MVVVVSDGSGRGRREGPGLQLLVVVREEEGSSSGPVLEGRRGNGQAGLDDGGLWLRQTPLRLGRAMKEMVRRGCGWWKERVGRGRGSGRRCGCGGLVGELSLLR